MYKGAIPRSSKLQRFLEATIMPENEQAQKVIVLEPQKVIVVEEADDSCDDNDWRGQGKRYSSKNSRCLSRIEDKATNSLNRVADAINHGADAYTKKRNKSEDEKKDGALVDFFVNAATGASTTISESAPVLIDVAEAFTTNRRRKQIRRFVRSFPFRF
jgi:hypothetical protein